MYFDVTDAFKIAVDVKDSNEVICHSSTHNTKTRVRGWAETPSPQSSGQLWPPLPPCVSLLVPKLPLLTGNAALCTVSS